LSIRALLRRPAGLAGILIVMSMTILAALATPFGEPSRSLLTRTMLDWGPQDEDRTIALPPSSPDRNHWLGTDIQRRDFLSRLLHGASISLQVGLAAEALALTIGLVVGALAGFYRGWIDSTLMRLADILLALPLPILAMAAIAVFETRSITLLFAVLGMMGWAGIARLTRAQCLTIARRNYSEAARALGASDMRLIARHVLPNAAAPALVAAAVGVAGNILTEAWLSFLGLGVQPPAISWGRMIVDGQSVLTLRPWLCLLPGLALGMTVLGFVLLADGLRDSIDPRARMATHIS